MNYVDFRDSSSSAPLASGPMRALQRNAYSQQPCIWHLHHWWMTFPLMFLLDWSPNPIPGSLQADPKLSRCSERPGIQPSMRLMKAPTEWSCRLTCRRPVGIRRTIRLPCHQEQPNLVSCCSAGAHPLPFEAPPLAILCLYVYFKHDRAPISGLLQYVVVVNVE
jgi:hypothetical protein